MFIPNEAFHMQDGIVGTLPTLWAGVDVPDGDAGHFVTAGVGSVYVYRDTTNDLSRTYTKVKNDGADSDWAQGVAVQRQTVTVSEFTDATTTGTLATNIVIPKYAYFLYATVTDVVGFAGDTSAALTIGDGTDVDRYNATTVDVFSTVAQVDAGVPSGALVHTAAKTVTLIITSASDFTSVVTDGNGALTVSVYYLI